MKRLIEQIQIALRNRARRQLCREYARNALRNKRIIAQLGLLNSRAEIEATAERIADEWPESAALRPQVDVWSKAA